MSTQATTKKKQAPPVFVFIAKKFLPPAMREEHLKKLTEQYESWDQFAILMISAIPASYRVQAVNTFNWAAFASQLLVTVLCFSATATAFSSARPVLWAVGVVM